MSTLATAGVDAGPLTDLLAAADPEYFRVGVPPGGTIPLSAFTDVHTVGTLIADSCRRTGRPEPTAVGFTLWYGAAGAFLAPAAAALLSGVRLGVDPDRTALRLGPDAMVDAVWIGYRTLPPEPPGTALGATAEWLREGLTRSGAAFRPHLRLGPRAFAAAAGDSLAKLAEQMGRSRGLVGPARQVVEALVAATGPVLRPSRYVEVRLGRGRRTAPTATVCCQWFRVCDGFCAGCPRQPEPARTVGLTEYLDRTLRPAVDDVASPGAAP